MNRKISLAESEQAIMDCYPVMAELRPHIQRSEFVSTVKRLFEIAGYRLAYLTDGGVKAVAGFRISEWLAGGKYLELRTSSRSAANVQKGMEGSCSIGWLNTPKKMVVITFGFFPG